MINEFRMIACGREDSRIFDFRKVFTCLSHTEMRCCIFILFGLHGCVCVCMKIVASGATAPCPTQSPKISKTKLL